VLVEKGDAVGAVDAVVVLLSVDVVEVAEAESLQFRPETSLMMSGQNLHLRNRLKSPANVRRRNGREQLGSAPFVLGRMKMPRLRRMRLEIR
jgi:hypothetical protein